MQYFKTLRGRLHFPDTATIGPLREPILLRPRQSSLVFLFDELLLLLCGDAQLVLHRD